MTPPAAKRPGRATAACRSSKSRAGRQSPSVNSANSQPSSRARRTASFTAPHLPNRPPARSRRTCTAPHRPTTSAVSGPLPSSATTTASGRRDWRDQPRGARSSQRGWSYVATRIAVRTYGMYRKGGAAAGLLRANPFMSMVALWGGSGHGQGGGRGAAGLGAAVGEAAPGKGGRRHGIVPGNRPRHRAGAGRRGRRAGRSLLPRRRPGSLADEGDRVAGRQGAAGAGRPFPARGLPQGPAGGSAGPGPGGDPDQQRRDQPRPYGAQDDRRRVGRGGPPGTLPLHRG